MRASKYAKITIAHGEPTRLALVLMCVFCAEESTRSQVPQTQPHQALCRLILLLHNHPDTIFTNCVLFGMQHGFRIGHTASLTREMSSENHPSASLNIQFVSDHLVSCCSGGGGANVGAVSYPSFPACSSFRPGKKMDKFRVTHDVSSPMGIELTTQSLPVRLAYNTNQWTLLSIPS